MLKRDNELMKKLSSLKKRAQLRLKTDLAPNTRNTTRWTSTYKMVSRYFKIKEFIDRNDPDLAPFILSAEDDVKLKTFFGELEKLNSITPKLQSEACTLLDMRAMVDRDIKDYGEELDHYLGSDDGTLTHNPIFERALIKCISGESLSSTEMEMLSVFYCKAQQRDAGSFYADECISAKNVRIGVKADWVPPTSNLCEFL